MYEIPLPATFPITEISRGEEGLGARIRGIKENCKVLEQNYTAPKKRELWEKGSQPRRTHTHHTQTQQQ